MPDLLVYSLLILALFVPTLGAIVLRFLARRLSEPWIIGGATVLLAIAMISVLSLSRSDIRDLRIGQLTLLLPSPRFSDDVDLPPIAMNQPDDAPVASPLQSTLPRATPSPRTTIAASPSISPTATPTIAEPTSTTTVAPPTATSEPPPPPGLRTYVIEEGDTLRSISEQFDVAVEAILEANGLSPEDGDALQVGQEIIIPSEIEPTAAPAELDPTADSEPPTATPEPPPPPPEPRVYVVESGDTLKSISEQFNVSVEAILEANNLTPEDGDALRVGQELIIP